MTTINSQIKEQFDNLQLVAGSLSKEALNIYIAKLEESFLQIIHNYASAPLTIGRLTKIIEENTAKLQDQDTVLAVADRDQMEAETGNATMQLERQKSDLAVAEENIVYMQELIMGFRGIAAKL